MLLDYRSLVSDDGVHLRSPERERKYFRTIRGAVLKQVLIYRSLTLDVRTSRSFL